MMFVIWALFVSYAFAGPVIGDFNVNLVCDGQEASVKGDGKQGPIAVSVTATIDEHTNATYALAVRWASDRGYLAGNGMACGQAVPVGMECMTSVATVNGDPANYLRQICGEPFRHFGGPYYPFDSGLTLDSQGDHGQFSCVAHDVGTSHTTKAITIQLANCKRQ